MNILYNMYCLLGAHTAPHTPQLVAQDGALEVSAEGFL
jgi:hypothetical protein